MRSLHTRTQLQQTQFTKTKKYGLRVMVGLLISALVVGTGQMTAQPTHALVPLIAKGTATAGALLYVILNQQQHEKARKKLEAQCVKPVNKNFPLCLPLQDITKPLPLADIQKWIKAQCKKDSACIEKLVQGIEILFKTFTKMPIQLGPTLCTHPNFTLLAETLEQYCKKGGFLSSKLGKPKPGGTIGIGGKTPISSSANSNSGAGGSGGANSEENPYTQREKLYKIIYNKINSVQHNLNENIRYYESVIKQIQVRSEQRRNENLGKYDSKKIADFEEKLRNTKVLLGKVKELFAELKSVQVQQRNLNLIIKNGTHSDEHRNKMNQKIIEDINKISRKYEEQILQDRRSEIAKTLNKQNPGTNTEYGKNLKSRIKQYIASKTPRDGVYQTNKKKEAMLANKKQAEALWNKIEALQVSLDNNINKMDIMHDENNAKEQKDIIKRLHENIQVELRGIDAEYQALKEKK